MMGILGLGRIQIKGRLLEFFPQIRREATQSFRDRRMDEHEKMHPV